MQDRNQSSQRDGQKPDMRSTQIARGIKGIFPLIKKHAPECISLLPSLDALPRSTRLAIDATLLIQRLHFADDAHPGRHLIGFHRLIRQLREHSLVPIMVFDNFSQGARLPAKMRENEKRRAKRNTLTLRARMEKMRGKRLEGLANVIKEWREMPREERNTASELLKTWKKAEQYSQIAAASDDALVDIDLLEDALAVDLELLEVAARKDSDEPLAISEVDRSDFLLDSIPIEEIVSPPSIYDQTPASDLWSSIQEAERSSVLNMASKIHHLRRQYATLLYADNAVQFGLNESIPPETAKQAELTEAEGEVYNRLQEGIFEVGVEVESLVGTCKKEQAATAIDSEEANVPEEEADDLALLTARNTLMQRSYSRSSTPLSRGIFEACATLCSLLKVPVLRTGDGSRSGGRRHEAEALASMLVRDGLADVVVSEDSDVLLYGAPLLRGVMGHKGLEYIDSARVSKTLFPPSGEANEEEAKQSSQKQMLDFALLCGTDFNRTVPGIGSMTALKLIREYKSIHNIRVEALRRAMALQVERRKEAKEMKEVTEIKEIKDSKEKSKKTTKGEVLFPMPDQLKWRDYSKELNEARRVFQNPPSPRWEAHKLKISKEGEQIDYEALTDFLQEHNIPTKEIKATLPPRPASSQSIPLGFGGSPFADGRGSASNWGTT